MPPYLGRVVVMQHLGKSMDFFRGMRFFYFCSVVQPFFDLADAGGTETGFYLLHIMQRVAYAQPVDGKVTVLAEYFITGQRIVQIAELDLELLLPAAYVTGSSERMLLYRELDGLTLDRDVDAFRARLEDRFGPVPPETEELLRIVPLRRLAARLGTEKVFLKGGRMTLFFVSNPDSPYYQSLAFGKVIAYMMKYTRRCDLREQNGKRSMVVKDVTTVEEAVSVLQEIVAMQVEE